MSDIAPVGPTSSTPPASTQGVGGAAAGQQASSGQSASANSMASSVAVQESHQSMSMSMSSQVETMVAQYGFGLESDESIRAMVILALMLQLLEAMQGGENKGMLIAPPTGNGGGGATLLMTSASFSASMSMESSSYQMTASEAYASASTANSQTGLPEGVAPTDTQGTAEGGDGGHQLDVVA